ncbi:MAG: hypothetical protein R2794_06450 [Chitinophagales bacterium]
MNEEKNSEKRGRGLLLILIFLLLGLNGWLFYNTYRSKEDREKSAQQIEEASILYGQLQAQYEEAKRELEDQKGDFNEKDSLIASLEAELESRKNEITTLLRTCNFYNGNSSKNEKKLDEVKEEVASMEVDCSQYQAQLEELNAKFLALQEDYEALQIAYENEVKRSEELTYERDSILDIGGFILSKDITITGVRKKNNGNDSDGQNAKHTDRLKICFDLLPNRLSAGQEQTFYVKIIGPNGKTLYNTENKSGEFVNKEKPGDNLYSKAVTLKYDGGDVESHCMYWEQEEEFHAGTYTVKIYHNGYMSSRATFTLKKPVLEDIISRFK